MLFRRLSYKLGNRLPIRGGWSPLSSTSTSSPLLPARNYSTTDPKNAGSEFIFSRLGDTTKITPIIAKLQQECWDGYVATGRGCHTLFQLLDTDSSGQISWQEIRFFLQNVRESDINPAARKEALEAASDGDIGFKEFQAWLIKATKVDPNTKNAFASEHYLASIGSAPKPLESEHSWNKHTMSQNLRRMQYAVRGEVVIRADASECLATPSTLWFAFCSTSCLMHFGSRSSFLTFCHTQHKQWRLRGERSSTQILATPMQSVRSP